MDYGVRIRSLICLNYLCEKSTLLTVNFHYEILVAVTCLPFSNIEIHNFPLPFPNFYTCESPVDRPVSY